MIRPLYDLISKFYFCCWASMLRLCDDFNRIYRSDDPEKFCYPFATVLALNND